MIEMVIGSLIMLLGIIVGFALAQAAHTTKEK